MVNGPNGVFDSRRGISAITSLDDAFTGAMDQKWRPKFCARDLVQLGGSTTTATGVAGRAGFFRGWTFPDHLDESHMAAAVVEQGHHETTGPEKRTVLADMPAFVGSGFVPDRGGQFYFRNAVADVGGGENKAGVFPEHIFAAVAEQISRAPIPSHDAILQIGGEYAVPLNALDRPAVPAGRRVLEFRFGVHPLCDSSQAPRGLSQVQI